MNQLSKTKAFDVSRIKPYIGLTKPGIIRGNLIVAIAGFLFASQGVVDIARLIAMALGTSLIIAAACVFNNILDMDRDKKMARTKKRALPSGQVSVKNAAIYGCALGFVGSVVLLGFVNVMTYIVGIIGFAVYVFVYTGLKPITRHATLLGGISGATPPVAGYVAVTEHFDLVAFLLFVALMCWQMPHFFAIGIFRSEDYKAAGIPIMPLSKGEKETKLQMMLYAFGFMLSCILIAVVARGSIIGFTVLLLASYYWIHYGFKGFDKQDTHKWAKGMFGISLLLLLLFSFVLAIDYYLPWHLFS